MTVSTYGHTSLPVEQVSPRGLLEGVSSVGHRCSLAEQRHLQVSESFSPGPSRGLGSSKSQCHGLDTSSGFCPLLATCQSRGSRAS